MYNNYNITDQQTINMYSKIIEDVTESMRDLWRNSGNDPRLLDKFRDNWAYETMKSININMAKPESFISTSNNSEIKTLDQILVDFQLPFQAVPQAPPQENKEEEEEKADDDDGFEDVDDGENADAQKKSASESSSSDSDSSTESDHEFDDDPEIKELLTQIETDSQLLCHYRSTKDKGKKHIQEFELSHIHLTHNGQPLFISHGTMSCPNNKARFS
ncbi:hypothetical protein TVAG_037480 [Trichomonas vaginalis G3]|uniref:Uncharacterized protein n=1 Tax=Trichomonas vaginalis (strain ATCC PRA-98 / G3) TaxID=412133 RepID=A2FCV5_TRIV3|nr:Transcription factor IIA (TFIIA), alpha-helical domain family [Trichomonas vaginalis G3]EAX97241.1 hypothetical protein TVAG_037480 [Trichomonas vaginalis G3]KAI5535864.1 Transcription factor IIA (TFIIA), alpha-helical domain family [Trichomonas vaginalis G3]|eukprot:XP_001310171.1 hypothetical protein [Trichomonas vaginalis G3]